MPRTTSVATRRRAAILKLEEFLPHRLNVLSSLVSQALTRVYGAIRYWNTGMAGAGHAWANIGVMTGKAIGAHTHMHKTKVSRAVAQLEQRKLVARRANRDDLREAFLSLTPAGRAVYEEARAASRSNSRSGCPRWWRRPTAPPSTARCKQLTERSAKLVADARKRQDLTAAANYPPASVRLRRHP